MIKSHMGGKRKTYRKNKKTSKYNKKSKSIKEYIKKTLITTN
jgi:hypothetical protein